MAGAARTRGGVPQRCLSRAPAPIAAVPARPQAHEYEQAQGLELQQFFDSTAGRFKTPTGCAAHGSSGHAAGEPRAARRAAHAYRAAAALTSRRPSPCYFHPRRKAWAAELVARRQAARSGAPPS
jgi:hypothetical protein